MLEPLRTASFTALNPCGISFHTRQCLPLSATRVGESRPRGWWRVPGGITRRGARRAGRWVPHLGAFGGFGPAFGPMCHLPKCAAVYPAPLTSSSLTKGPKRSFI